METKNLLRISDGKCTVSSFKFYSTCNFNATYNNMTDSISLLTRGTLNKPNELKLSNWGKICTTSTDKVNKKRKRRVPVTFISVIAKQGRNQSSYAKNLIRITTKPNLPILPINMNSTGYIPVRGGKIYLYYSPKTTENNYPVIVYNNWEGWVTADLNT